MNQKNIQTDACQLRFLFVIKGAIPLYVTAVPRPLCLFYFFAVSYVVSTFLSESEGSRCGPEATPTSLLHFTTFTSHSYRTPPTPPTSRPPLTPHSHLPSPPPHLIRSSSVARHHGLFLHSADTWQTNECPFVWRDPPQIAPKMHHAGICLFFVLFFCIFNACTRVCSVAVQRSREPHLFFSCHTSEC